jgi:hypothetical protein
MITRNTLHCAVLCLACHFHDNNIDNFECDTVSSRRLDKVDYSISNASVYVELCALDEQHVVYFHHSPSDSLQKQRTSSLLDAYIRFTRCDLFVLQLTGLEYII